MPPNKNRQKRKLQSAGSPPPPPPAEIQNQTQPPQLTGNEEYNKNIFIEMETNTNSNLLVADQHPPQQQQTDTTVHVNQQVGLEATSVQANPPLIEDHRQETVVEMNNVADEPPTSVGSTADGEIENEESLSASVTRLSTPNGAEVFLIGTAHFSPMSVRDVQRVIRSIKPSSVMLELCRERAFMLNLDEESLLEQNKKLSFEKIRSAIAEKGIAQGLIYIMFIKMSASLTEKLGLAPGAEFRAGSAEAQKIPGCSVVLADRSLRVTVARAVASVSFWQQLKLIYQVLITDVSVTQEDVEKCKDKDMLEQLLEELGGEFPGFKRVLLDERNIYLAHSIYQWAQNSETSLGPQRVVAIVGIGHVSGIVENWGKTTDKQIRSLNEIPTKSKTRRIISKTIKYCTFALLIYAGYRVMVPSSLQAAITDKLMGSQSK